MSAETSLRDDRKRSSVVPQRKHEAPLDEAAVRAARWRTFVLLRTVIEQSASSLVTEALIKLDELEARITEAETLGDA